MNSGFKAPIISIGVGSIREKDVCNEIPNDKVTPSMVYNKWSFPFLSHLDHYFC